MMVDRLMKERDDNRQQQEAFENRLAEMRRNLTAAGYEVMEANRQKKEFEQQVLLREKALADMQRIAQENEALKAAVDDADAMYADYKRVANERNEYRKQAFETTKLRDEMRDANAVMADMKQRLESMAEDKKRLTLEAGDAKSDLDAARNALDAEQVEYRDLLERFQAAQVDMKSLEETNMALRQEREVQKRLLEGYKEREQGLPALIAEAEQKLRMQFETEKAGWQKTLGEKDSMVEKYKRAEQDLRMQFETEKAGWQKTLDEKDSMLEKYREAEQEWKEGEEFIDVLERQQKEMRERHEQEIADLKKEQEERLERARDEWAEEDKLGMAKQQEQHEMELQTMRNAITQVRQKEKEAYARQLVEKERQRNAAIEESKRLQREVAAMQRPAGVYKTRPVLERRLRELDEENKGLKTRLDTLQNIRREVVDEKTGIIHDVRTTLGWTSDDIRSDNYKQKMREVVDMASKFSDAADANRVLAQDYGNIGLELAAASQLIGDQMTEIERLRGQRS